MTGGPLESLDLLAERVRCEWSETSAAAVRCEFAETAASAVLCESAETPAAAVGCESLPVAALCRAAAVARCSTRLLFLSIFN